MESFHVNRLPAGSSVRFTGGASDDHLTVLGAPTTAVMGPGDDLVDVEAGPRMLAGGLFVDGGTGEDLLRIDRAPTVSLNLTTGRLRFGEATGNPRQTRALRLENVDVLTSGALRLIGTSGPNRLRYAGCSGSVSAKGGDDVLEFRANADWGCEDEMVLPVGGGAGDDALVGGRQDDQLAGGAGRDRADGRSGRDVCVAETTRRCEA
jgi:Ca2+-binding RTX toxin-like protein